jgi:hypothetical protein
MRGFLKIAGTIAALLVGWAVVFMAISMLLDGLGSYQWRRQIAVVAIVVVFLGFWFVHTGRLARMFRKV